jgi:type I restriction enzyme, S subunit
MSRIDQLIAELCPEGVEFKTLSDVGKFIRGTGLQKKDLAEIGVGAIHYGQVYTHYGIWATETKSFVSPEMAKRLRKAKCGDLVIATTSENDEDVCKAVAWLGKEDIAISSDAYIFSHSLEPKYVAYFFNSDQFQSQKARHITGTKVKRVSGESMAKFRIPAPPLEVQREIVKVLDSFTQLEAELEAELEARRRQYQYFRDAMLNFDADASHDEAKTQSVRWATLGEICQINRGRVISKDYLREHTGPYPVYSSQTANGGVFGSINTYDYDFESITWTTDGANAGSVFYHSDKKFSITNVCGLLRVLDNNQMSTKFLYYVLGQLTKRYVSDGMGNPKLMSNIMSQIKVPVPPVEEQERIVAILDKFDALVNDLSSGLPAEIKARRQQYAHYRDRLLSFKEAT